MSDQTNRYKLPYLLPAQAQKHVTHNEAIRLLDGMTNLNLKGIGFDTPPTGALEGDAYGIGNAPVDEWVNQPGNIAVFADASWIFSEPFQGLRAFDETTGNLLVYDDNAWVPVSGSVEETEKLGINTAPDDINKLSVKSDSVLITTDDLSSQPTGDVRLTLNKTGAGNVNSVLFQTGYSARAEFGCAGNDHFQIKVSEDGSNFTSAVEIDSANGNIGIGKFPSNCLDVQRDDEGQISRFQLRNTKVASGSGAAMNVSSGSHVTQFLQYSAGAAYFVSSSNTFYLQTTGSNPKISFFAGSVNAANFSSQNVSFNIPAKMPNYTVANLPAAATAGAGSMIYVSDETSGAVIAFSDGAVWRRCTDRQIVS